MQNERRSKGYTFSTVPSCVYSEIVKLNVVEFKPKPLVSEDTKAKHKDRTPDKQGSIDHQFTNYYLNIAHHEQHQQQQEHQKPQQQQYNHHQKQHPQMQ